jgi:chromosome segregation ATPase
MYISSFEFCVAAGFIALVVYSLKICITESLATKLHKQIAREKLIRAQLEDKLRTLNNLETQLIELDKQQKCLRQDISSKKEQLETDQKLFQSLVNRQNQLSEHIQRERETLLMKDEEYKQEVSEIEQQTELRRAQFVSKMSLYNKEMDAYAEQEAALKKIISTIKEEKTASKTIQELEHIQSQKMKDVEQSRQMLFDLSAVEERINEDIRKKLSIIKFKLGSTTLSGHVRDIEGEPVVSTNTEK